MTTQTEQMEAFPKTTMEVLESLRAFHVADVEKAGTALDNLGDEEKVARRYEKAEERLAAARDLVRDIDRAIDELTKMKPAELDAHDVEYVDFVTDQPLPAVDPFTGEVASSVPVTDEEKRDELESEMNAERGDPFDPIADNLLGEIAPAVVIAFYPSDDEPHETQVGDRTRYGELVADYFTAAGLSAEVDADEWGVDALRELTQDGGGYRSLHDVIAPEDYGQELLVVALEQGSVTGAPVEKVVT